MLGRRFSIRDSQTKSRFRFRRRELSNAQTRTSIFRDPAAIPLLQQMADNLSLRGYKVTKPKPGKACHGAFGVEFPNVQIIVIMLVERGPDFVEFFILSWPSQTLAQRLRTPKPRSPDFAEWREVCSAIHDFLAHDLETEGLEWTTCMEGEGRALEKH
jgi:hypothetical protein